MKLYLVFNHGDAYQNSFVLQQDINNLGLRHKEGHADPPPLPQK